MASTRNKILQKQAPVDYSGMDSAMAETLENERRRRVGFQKAAEATNEVSHTDFTSPVHKFIGKVRSMVGLSTPHDADWATVEKQIQEKRAQVRGARELTRRMGR